MAAPSLRMRGTSRVSFLRKFREHGLQVAMVRPASAYLAKAHCLYLDSSRPQVIVELGAGTGPITEAVCQRMHPDSKLLAFEIDPDFAAVVRERCPCATVLEEDAANLPQLAAEHGVDRIDLIICCLALPYLPRDTVRAIFDSVHTLGSNGWFIQQTLVPLVYRRMYTRLFEEVQFRCVLRNLPPAGVYHCRRLREEYRSHLPGR